MLDFLALDLSTTHNSGCLIVGICTMYFSHGSKWYSSAWRFQIFFHLKSTAEMGQGHFSHLCAQRIVPPQLQKMQKKQIYYSWMNCKGSERMTQAGRSSYLRTAAMFRCVPANLRCACRVWTKKAAEPPSQPSTLFLSGAWQSSFVTLKPWSRLESVNTYCVWTGIILSDACTCVKTKGENLVWRCAERQLPFSQDLPDSRIWRIKKVSQAVFYPNETNLKQLAIKSAVTRGLRRATELSSCSIDNTGIGWGIPEGCQNHSELHNSHFG